MKLLKLYFLLSLLLFIFSCNKNDDAQNVDIPRGIIEAVLSFENEFGENLSPPYPPVEVTLEKDGITQTKNSDSMRIVRFIGLEWGTYNVTVQSEEYGTCLRHQIEIDEDNLGRGAFFYLKGIPNSSFEFIQVDSFINNHMIYWSCSLTPVTGKPLTIRFYYGDDREVSKDNYIYTRAGGGYNVYDYQTSSLSTADRIDINDFSPTADSIYIAAYIAAAGYERCIGTNMGLDAFSPEGGEPVILALKKH